MKKQNQSEENLIRCPLCGHDEYLISADCENFTCARCGFHTTELSAISYTPVCIANPEELHIFTHSPTNLHH